MCIAQVLAQMTKVMLANNIDLFPPLICTPLKVRDCVTICLINQHHLGLWSICVCVHVCVSVKSTCILKFIKFKFMFNPTTRFMLPSTSRPSLFYLDFFNLFQFLYLFVFSISIVMKVPRDRWEEWFLKNNKQTKKPQTLCIRQSSHGV